MALRYSKQREAIARNLKNRTDHPSADMVFETVREDMPKISLGTVYRNLKDMSESGEAISFMVGGKEHFDGNFEPHLHLCCMKCGKIEDRFLGQEAIQNIVSDDFDVHNVVLQGICGECQKAEGEPEAEAI